MTGRALAAAIAIAAAGSSSASADARPARVVAAVPGDRAGVEHAILIGQSGEIYRPHEGGWRRDGAGGVAGDVEGAVRASDGAIQVVAGRAPVYARVDGAWRVVSLDERRGSRASTHTGVPVLVAGRNAYVFEADRWRRVASIAGRVARVWASTADKIYTVDDTGAMERGSGRRWTPIASGFADTETIELLVGVPGAALYAIGDAGTIMNVGAAGMKPVPIPGELQGLRVVGAGAAPRGPVYLVARLADRHALVSLDGNALALVADLPALADAGDRWSVVLADAKGAILVASWAGQIRVRGADAAWTDRAIDVAPPTSPHPGPGPARTK